MKGTIQLVALDPVASSAWLAGVMDVDLRCFGAPHAWREPEFMADRPEKWRLSCAATKDDRIVGVAMGYLWARKVAHLSRLGVLPSARGNRVGEMLVRHFQENASAIGCEAMTLEFEDSLGVADFYTRCGFRELSPEGVGTYLKLKGKYSQVSRYGPHGRRVFAYSAAAAFDVARINKEDLLT